MRFTLRRLLVGIAIIAFAMATYRLILFDVKRCKMAIGVFGPSFEHHGVVYDRQRLHSQIVGDVEQAGFHAIDQPIWSNDIEISGSTGWRPSRSDWFAVERHGVQNYVHISSAHDGLAIDIWTNKGVMLHQRDDVDRVLSRELMLADELEMEIKTKWVYWCKAYRENRITMSSTEGLQDAFTNGNHIGGSR